MSPTLDQSAVRSRPRNHERAKAEAFARGLLIYPGGGTIDGRSGDHILLAPPYNVTDDELGIIVDLLADTIDAVLPS